MEAYSRRLQTMEIVITTDRKMVMAAVSRADVTGYRSGEKRSLMVDIHRECNRP
jgi:hypothetical protein